MTTATPMAPNRSHFDRFARGLGFESSPFLGAMATVMLLADL